MENCGCRFLCHEHFDQKAQEGLFNDYIRVENKTEFLSQFVVQKDVERRRPRLHVIKKAKSRSRFYYLTAGNGERVRVCQKFFCFVFQISFQVIETMLQKRTPNGALLNKQHGLTGKKPANATSEEQLKVVQAHIKSFPRVPSHYCRRRSKNLYLSPELNISLAYRLYVDMCREKNMLHQVVKEPIYRKQFRTHEPPLRFYIPKKDQCTLCNVWKDSPQPKPLALNDKYHAHKQRENDSLVMKNVDMQNCAANQRTITFDMQANICLPFAGDAQIYYKRKLNVLNFTIYDNNADGFCYLFDEANGRKGCNETATCILEYLKDLPTSVSHVTTWSDTCAAQNRNYNFLSMLVYAVNFIDHLNTVDVKYLESGHSYLNCDSMHANIERKMKHRKVYTPPEVRVIMETARINPRPYNVRMMNYSDFFNIKKLSDRIMKNWKVNEENDKIRWLNIKWFRIEKGSDCILYKYDYNGDFHKFNFTRSPPSPKKGRKSSVKPIAVCEIKLETLTPLYYEILKVSPQKKKDLLSLVKEGVIPAYYAQFYTSLETDSAAKDKIYYLDDDLLVGVDEEEMIVEELGLNGD